MFAKPESRSVAEDTSIALGAEIYFLGQRTLMTTFLNNMVCTFLLMSAAGKQNKT